MSWLPSMNSNQSLKAQYPKQHCVKLVIITRLNMTTASSNGLFNIKRFKNKDNNNHKGMAVHFWNKEHLR